MLDVFGLQVDPWTYWIGVATLIGTAYGVAVALWQERRKRREQASVEGGENAPAPAPPARVWNVPFPRNLNFTGREDLLKVLGTKLRSGRATALTQTAAVHGLGGIGKTQLAIEYCYRHVKDYQCVWWIRAEASASLAADLAALAPRLGIQPQQEQAAAVTLVKQALDQRDGWLLVFDNVQEPKDVSPYLPQCGRGHIIITSQRSDWGNTAQELRVEELPRDKAIEFLLQRTGSRDEEGADELAGELGCLPLALEQAGAYVRAAGLSFADYIELYRKQHQEMLRRGALDKERYPDTVATTWNISFDKAALESGGAPELLGILSFLAAEDIPKEMLDAEAADRLTRADAIAALHKYSLLTTKEETLSVHRLVQDVVRDRMDKTRRKAAAETALGIVNRAFPHESHDVRTRERCARLLPHALSVLRHVDELKLEPEGMGRLLNQVGLYFKAQAAHADAEPLYKRALEIGRNALGEEHPTVALRMNNLGSLYQAMGRFGDAEPLYKRALEILEKALGQDHLDVATACNNLAGLYRAMGRLADAEPLQLRALKIREAKLPENHPHIASGLNNLALLYQATGRLREAEPLYRRALEIGEKALGRDHPDVAIWLNNLAEWYRAMGRLDEAEPLYKRALEIDKKTLGKDHPGTATDMNNLAVLYRALGRLKDAEPLQLRALQIREAKLPERHPDIALSLSNLADLYSDQGRLPEAEPLYLRALGIMEKSVGKEHPDTRKVARNFKALKKALGR